MSLGAAVAVGVLAGQLGEQRGGERIVLGHRDKPQPVAARHRHALSDANPDCAFLSRVRWTVDRVAGGL